jgi:hypothetical protein
MSGIHLGSHQHGDAYAEIAETSQADDSDPHTRLGSPFCDHGVVCRQTGIRRHRSHLEGKLFRKPHEVRLGGADRGPVTAVPGAISDGIAVRHRRRQPDTVADFPMVHPRPDFADDAGILVTESHRESDERGHPLRLVERAHVGCAQSGGLHVDDHFARARVRLFDLVECQGFAGSVESP